MIDDAFIYSKVYPYPMGVADVIHAEIRQIELLNVVGPRTVTPGLLARNVPIN